MKAFLCFASPPCPTSGSRLSEVSFQKAPSNAAKECSLICPELFRTQLFFVFFLPKINSGSVDLLKPACVEFYVNV